MNVKTSVIPAGVGNPSAETGSASIPELPKAGAFGFAAIWKNAVAPFASHSPSHSADDDPRFTGAKLSTEAQGASCHTPAAETKAPTHSRWSGGAVPIGRNLTTERPPISAANRTGQSGRTSKPPGKSIGKRGDTVRGSRLATKPPLPVTKAEESAKPLVSDETQACQKAVDGSGTAPANAQLIASPTAPPRQQSDARQPTQMVSALWTPAAPERNISPAGRVDSSVTQIPSTTDLHWPSQAADFHANVPRVLEAARKPGTGAMAKPEIVAGDRFVPQDYRAAELEPESGAAKTPESRAVTDRTEGSAGVEEQTDSGELEPEPSLPIVREVGRQEETRPSSPLPRSRPSIGSQVQVVSVDRAAQGPSAAQPIQRRVFSAPINAVLEDADASAVDNEVLQLGIRQSEPAEPARMATHENSKVFKAVKTELESSSSLVSAERFDPEVLPQAASLGCRQWSVQMVGPADRAEVGLGYSAVLKSTDQPPVPGGASMAVPIGKTTRAEMDFDPDQNSSRTDLQGNSRMLNEVALFSPEERESMVNGGTLKATTNSVLNPTSQSKARIVDAAPVMLANQENDGTFETGKIALSSRLAEKTAPNAKPEERSTDFGKVESLGSTSFLAESGIPGEVLVPFPNGSSSASQLSLETSTVGRAKLHKPNPQVKDKTDQDIQTRSAPDVEDDFDSGFDQELTGYTSGQVSSPDRNGKEAPLKNVELKSDLVNPIEAGARKTKTAALTSPRKDLEAAIYSPTSSQVNPRAAGEDSFPGLAFPLASKEALPTGDREWRPPLVASSEHSSQESDERSLVLRAQAPAVSSETPAEEGTVGTIMNAREISFGAVALDQAFRAPMEAVRGVSEKVEAASAVPPAAPKRAAGATVLPEHASPLANDRSVDQASVSQALEPKTSSSNDLPESGAKPSEPEVLTDSKPGQLAPGETEEVRGTAAAHAHNQMQHAANKNESAGFTEQELPVAAAPSRRSAPTPRAELTAVKVEGLSEPAPTSVPAPAPAAWPEESKLSRLSQDSMEKTPLPAAHERLLKLVQSEIQGLGTMRVEKVAVVLRPDAETEISLRVSVQNGQIEAQARCERGNFEALNSDWKRLQQDLSACGVRLAPLGNSGAVVHQTSSADGSSEPFHAGSSFENQRQPQHFARSAEQENHPLGTSLPKAAPRLRKPSARLLELWA